MYKYTVRLSKRSIKFLENLSDTIAAPILSVAKSLSENPRPFGYIKLKGRDAYRIRVGNYRIIYEIWDDVLVVSVIAIGHRKDVYT